MTIDFGCDARGPSVPLPHFWEHTVGSDHAAMALRVDWRAQLQRAHAELGFEYVRFHGFLSDDVGAFTRIGETKIYSFHNVDLIFDFLLSIGMKPFVELSFMPTGLASGPQEVFHYRGNISLPTSYPAWAELIENLVRHCVQRYGLAEVRQWFFEVWNEPNLGFFFVGGFDDYIELYAHATRAIKSVDGELRVGGPATAANAWIEEFVARCREIDAPVDFISTHHYPTDAFGKPEDDTVTQLALGHPSALREQAAKVKGEAAGLPVHYTEWSSSSNPRDELHDETFAACFIVKTVLEARGLVEAYGWWTFSDIFEENYFPSIQFHGGFGLLTIDGVAKPAYRAFEVLHALGEELLDVEGAHETVNCWAIRRERTITLLFCNFALPRWPIAERSVRMTLRNAVARSAEIRRIDADHANPKRLWLEMGEPEDLAAQDLARLGEASRCDAEAMDFANTANGVSFELSLEPLAIAAVTVALDAVPMA